MKKNYSLNYEAGRCQYGYEFVEAHRRNGIEIDSYCRKIPKKRFAFSDPDARMDRGDEREKTRREEEAKRIFWKARENRGQIESEEHL